MAPEVCSSEELFLEKLQLVTLCDEARMVGFGETGENFLGPMTREKPPLVFDFLKKMKKKKYIFEHLTFL